MINSDDILSRMRDALGVETDTQLATALDLPRATVSNWRYRNSIPFEACVSLAQSRGISLNWLLLGEGERRITTSQHDVVGPMASRSDTRIPVVGAVLRDYRAASEKEAARLGVELGLGMVALMARRSSYGAAWRLIRVLASAPPEGLLASEVQERVVGPNPSEADSGDFAADVQLMLRRGLLLQSELGGDLVLRLAEHGVVRPTADADVAELLQEALRILVNDVWPNVAEETGALVVTKARILPKDLQPTIKEIKASIMAILESRDSNAPEAEWLNLVMGAARSES